VKDYFAIPGPVTFNKTNYYLSWSSHPNDNYYKQEYLPSGEKAETFSNMIMIEALVGDMSLQDAVQTKIAEIEQRKKTDPVANYQIIKNPSTGEYLLDFVYSQSTGNKTSVVEWNAYRYVSLKDKSVSNGVLLFAYSKRGYGDAVTNFLKTLKTGRQADINMIAAYKIPGVKLK
jgi:hypothetical protein